MSSKVGAPKCQVQVSNFAILFKVESWVQLLPCEALSPKLAFSLVSCPVLPSPILISLWPTRKWCRKMALVQSCWNAFPKCLPLKTLHIEVICHILWLWQFLLNSQCPHYAINLYSHDQKYSSFPRNIIKLANTASISDISFLCCSNEFASVMLSALQLSLNCWFTFCCRQDSTEKS